MSEDRPLEVLTQYWGHEQFRPYQREIIDSILNGSDTLAVLPTGAGKSICFQIPAIVLEGVTLVISPLIALINDQVSRLQKLGIRARALHSGLSRRDRESILNEAFHRQIDLLYVSPERLASETFRQQVQEFSIKLVVIDEAHCVSLWGYDFRPAYLELGDLRTLLPAASYVALTATAAPKVVDDIIDKLKMVEPVTFRASSRRPALKFGVITCEDKQHRLCRLMNQVAGPAIVYCNSRKHTHEIARLLVREGFNAGAYHAGLPPAERLQIEEAFLSDTLRIIVSTNAFGMGVDKHNVRLVVHYDLTASAEAYYQEAGRAGRDGTSAYALILHHPHDLTTMTKLWEQEFPGLAMIERVYQALGNHFQLAVGGSRGRVFSFDQDEFCARYRLKANETRNALLILQQSGWISMQSGYNQPSRMRFRLDSREIYTFQVQHPESETMINFLLRRYQGILFHYVNINERQIARQLGGDAAAVQTKLMQLQKKGVLDYAPGSDEPKLIFLRDRVKVRNLTIDKERYRFRKQRGKEALQKMQEYLQTQMCRQLVLGQLLGDSELEACGICDNCKKNLTVTTEQKANYQRRLLSMIGAKEVSLQDLLSNFTDAEHQEVMNSLELLVGEDRIRRDYDKFYR